MRKKYEEYNCKDFVSFRKIADKKLYMITHMAKYKKEYDEAMEKVRSMKGAPKWLRYTLIGLAFATVIVGAFLTLYFGNGLFFLFGISCSFILLALFFASEPKKTNLYYNGYAPENFRLKCPKIMYFSANKAKRGQQVTYNVFFEDFDKDDYGIAMTHKTYGESEKKALISSYTEGRLVVAVCGNRAIILEY